MSRPRTLKPKLCHDKTSGRAFFLIDGKKTYCGRYGAQEAQEAYDRLIGEWIGAGRVVAAPAAEMSVERVADVCAAFWTYAKATYADPEDREGKRPKGALGNYWDVLRPLGRLYGEAPAAEFGPIALKAVRAAMLQPRTVVDATTGDAKTILGWCRNVANRNVSRIKLIFRWAAEEELVSGEVAARLWAVQGLRAGRSDARETEPVKLVPQAYIDAALPHCSRQVQTMIKLQLLTGMRTGEACTMKTREIDTSPNLPVVPVVRRLVFQRAVDPARVRLGQLAEQKLFI
jgi:integrase